MKHLREGYLGEHETAVMLIIFLATKIFLSFPQAMVHVARTSAWIVPALSALWALPGLWALCALMRRFPGRSIIEVAEEVAGPWLGGLAALAIFLTFLVITVAILRQFTESIVTMVLPETPVSVIAAIFTVAITFGAYKGMEAITRTAWIIFPWIAAGLGIILVLVLPWADYHRLFPPLGLGLGQLLLLGPQKVSMYTEFIILGLVFPSLRYSARPFRLGLVVLLASILIISSTLAVFLAVYSVADGERQVFPVYQLSRLIYLGRFVQRIDAIFVLVWVISGLLKLSVSLYGTAAALGRFLRLPLYQPLVFPLALIAFALSFWPPDITAAVALDQHVLRTWGWAPAFGLPLVLLGAASLRKTRAVRNG